MDVAKAQYFIYFVCNRCLYRKSVLTFNETKYNINVERFCYKKVNSYDRCQYICKCDTKLKREKIPFQNRVFGTTYSFFSFLITFLA